MGIAEIMYTESFFASVQQRTRVFEFLIKICSPFIF